MNQLVPIEQHSNVEAYRASTDAAELCKAIVVATASNIQGKRYVSVEGWMAIARAHGCAAGASQVERVSGGVRAVGEVRDMHSGVIIATAEGFVGEDEPTWFGGDNGKGRTLPKRADYAIRAMAQTRAISRACRSAFAHVVVMMNAGLATTPAEEVPVGGFDRETGEVFDAPPAATQPRQEPEARAKLEGPHSSKTALKKAVDGIRNKVALISSVEDLNALLKAEKATLDQAAKDWPALLNGFEDIPEDTGLRGAVQAKRAALAEDGALQVMIRSMKECQTPTALNNWMIANEEAIAALDGAESRTFTLAFELHESALRTVATLNA